jgi:chemotaxis signal transduction protein
VAESHPSEGAAELRRAFDASFALAPAQPPAGVAYLAIRVDERPYALPLADCAALLRCPPLTACPTRERAWLGLCAVRGTLLAVYSLELLLHGPRPEREPARWLVRSAQDAGAAFAFGGLEGYLRAGAQSAAAGQGQRAWLAQHVAGEPARGIVELAALLAELGGAARSGAPPREGE